MGRKINAQTDQDQEYVRAIHGYDHGSILLIKREYGGGGFLFVFPCLIDID
jgi:hypothetical protein